MLCKISMAMFPLVIFLYAWWKRGRIGWSDAKESAPFFAMSLILGMATAFLGQHYEANNIADLMNIPVGGILSRIALGGLSLASYFYKSLLPIGLVPMYPQWSVNPPSLWQFLPWLVFAAAAGWFWLRRETWGRHALLGCGFFVILLLPFIGFKDISYMRFTWVMDHFLYIPILGLIGVAVAGTEIIWTRLSPMPRQFVGAGAILIATVLAVGSHRYAKIFHDSMSLWTYTLKHNPNSNGAHDNLGVYLSKKGDYPDAIAQFQEAYQIDPGDTLAHNNLGIAFIDMRRFPEAIAEFREALRINPDNFKSHFNLGNALVATGQLEDAVAEYREAVRLSPDYLEGHVGLGAALIQAGDPADAISEFNAALQLNRFDVLAHVNLALCMTQLNRFSEATDEINQALRLGPNNPSPHIGYGYILAQQGHLDEAIEQYQIALSLNPNEPQAHYHLGMALAKAGRLAEAIDQFQAALQIMPGNASAQNALIQAQAQLESRK
jgi:tetratricopeptide (TPR) repeat protein